MRDMRPDVIEIVRGCADDHDGDLPACDVLMIPDVLVDRDEDIKTLLCQREQLPILFTAEPRLSSGFALVPAFGKQELHLPGQALVNEQLHFNVAAKLILASSRAAMASARVTLGKSSRNSLRLCSRSRSSVSDLKGTRVPPRTNNERAKTTSATPASPRHAAPDAPAESSYSPVSDARDSSAAPQTAAGPDQSRSTFL